MTGTSTSTPTTVASAAPDESPKSEMAVATASSKKLLAPIKPAGAANGKSRPPLAQSYAEEDTGGHPRCQVSLKET